jgi:hypothetical protein
MWSCVVVEVRGEDVFGGRVVFDCGGGSGGWVGGSVVVDGVMDVGGVGGGGLAGYVEGVGSVVCVDGYCRLPVRFLDASNPLFYLTRCDAHAVCLFCGG